ncbi:MAG: hemoglobin [Rhizobiales bacterium 65-9]|nr:group III truncated hemoglobin [Hyphomicrobiales bacterium]OJY38713.1 MAG: hemoglobin [Rhizobiales bacterium 65-9]
MESNARPRDISEQLVERLVHDFYARVRADETLGPIFEARLSGRWDRHLAAMVDFWSSVTLTSGRYRGRPHAAHQALGLTPAHFGRWLDLFETTVRELCAGEAADTFIDRAHRIADSLQIGLNIGPKALRFPDTRVAAAS